ncbi:MAG: hypothetical protein IT436_05635 [Phycisphaerales bacterium]|nr:hypothetical protein [Phycisphaerales bacterium]
MKLGMMVCAAVLAAAMAGCSSEQKTTAKAETKAEAPAAMSVNKTCPIGGHAAVASKTVAYKGKTIGFCCSDCIESFNGMSEAEKDAVLAKATTGK